MQICVIIFSDDDDDKYIHHKHAKYKNTFYTGRASIPQHPAVEMTKYLNIFSKSKYEKCVIEEYKISRWVVTKLVCK